MSKERVNITIDLSALSTIDAAAKLAERNRSEYLVECALREAKKNLKTCKTCGGSGYIRTKK